MLVVERVEIHYLVHPDKNRRYVFKVYEYGVEVECCRDRMMQRPRRMTREEARRYYAFLVNTHKYQPW